MAVFLYENIGDAVAHLAHNQSQFTGCCLENNKCDLDLEHRLCEDLLGQR